MPTSGPHSSLIRNANVPLVQLPTPEGQPPFILMDVTPPLLPLVAAIETEQIHRAITNWPATTAPTIVHVGTDDIIQLTIYEADTGGLFIPENGTPNTGNFIQLPPQLIDEKGTIHVPYAGLVKVAGRSVKDIERDIVSKLQHKAIDPQVVISFVERASAMVNIVGAVNGAQRSALSLQGHKVLDLIAEAGGPRFEGYETMVTLQRRNQSYRIPFNALLQDVTRNIYLQPNDTLYLDRDPHRFTIMGAVGFAGNYRFEAPSLMLSEAIGRGAGLDDNRADPAEVYLYRHERTSHIKKLLSDRPSDSDNITKSTMKEDILNINLNDTSSGNTAKIAEKQPMQPVIYKFNLRSADGLFLTQKFPVRNNDMIYVANAESVELVKFLNIINPGAVTTVNTRSSSD